MTDHELAERERRLFLNEALTEYPGARGMEDLISATDEQGIHEQARRLHERVSDRSPQERARELYGPSGGSGGAGLSGTAALHAGESRDLRAQMEFADRFNSAPRDQYGQRTGISPMEVDTYVRSRFIGHVMDRVSHWASLTRSDAGHRR